MAEQLIKIINKKCKICYACVRVCPVKAIEVYVDRDYPKVNPDRCVGCGTCLAVCGPNAISYRDSKQLTKTILESGKPSVAIVAPSISGEFADITDYRKFVEMIRALGFNYVNEVSFGVDLVARKYKELIDHFNGKYYIMANCPVVVSLVEKYHPELIKNLAPILSPMTATTKLVRQQYGDDIKVVYIGPCIANKDEAEYHEGAEKPDAVLTFVELRELFAEFNIHENQVEYSDFDAPIGNKGSLYPISNGIIQAAEIDENLYTTQIITTEGKSNTLAALREFEKSIESIKHHFNVFYCGGCLMGPGTSKGGEKFNRRALVIDYARKRSLSFNKSSWKKDVEKFKGLSFDRSYVSNDQRIEEPLEEKITEVLKVIGKESDRDEIGCEACGYRSCTDFAKAVAQGITKPDMCISYSLKTKHEYISSLKYANEKLALTKEALKKSEETARTEKMMAQEALERTSSMLQKLPSGVVIVDDKMKIVEANKSFINILGDDAKEIDEIIPGLAGADIKTLIPYSIYNIFSYVLLNDENVINRDVQYEDRLFNISVFTLKKNKIVGAVLRDMYQPDIRSEEVITRVTDVIDKNLELVQKIGFVLGEGAAETERMLNSIIESYRSGRKTEE